MQFITLLDYLLLPFILAFVFGIALSMRRTLYPEGHPWRPYFIPGLVVKVVGSVFIGMLYQYYYGGGDTANFFHHAKVINSAFLSSPLKWLNLVLHIPQWYDGQYSEYISQLYWYTTLNNYLVGAVAACAGIFTFTTFLPTSVLFAALSYTGSWAMFRTFAQQYPHLVRQVAIATLFIPSTFIWGSGIFKDTLCIFGLGWVLYATYEILLKGTFAIRTLVLGLIGLYLIAVIKIYILIAFIPALLFWIFSTYSARIQSQLMRLFAVLSIIGISVSGVWLLSDKLTQELGAYSIENLAKTSGATRDYIYRISGDEGSAYDIGVIEPSLAGMLTKVPQSVNVTLFRPYLWEARKPIVFFNSLEAFLFLLITVRVFFSIGLRKVLRAIGSDPNIQFMLIFTLIFSFAVGISSGNFGALSRYRIPCLPMYCLALMLIYYKYKPPQKPLLGL